MQRPVSPNRPARRGSSLQVRPSDPSRGGACSLDARAFELRYLVDDDQHGVDDQDAAHIDVFRQCTMTFFVRDGCGGDYTH